MTNINFIQKMRQVYGNQDSVTNLTHCNIITDDNYIGGVLVV